MIALFGNNEEKLEIGYHGLTINDPDDDPDDTYEPAIAIARYALDEVLEPKAEQDGSEGYAPRKISKIIRIDGMVKAPSNRRLWDKVEALNEAYDPVLTFEDDVASTYDRGYLPLTFAVPTNDTANYPSGLIGMQYYARPIAQPIELASKFQGHNAPFHIEMLAIDPRRYSQTLTSQTLVNGANTVNNTLASYPSYPVIVLTMSGAGTDGWFIGHETELVSLYLNLAGAGQTIEIDMAKHVVRKNGVEDMTLFKSGKFWKLGRQSHTVTVSNVTGISQVQIQWRRAFV